MTRQRKLQLGLGAALLAAAAFTSATAGAQQSVICSASGAFGRQYARLTVSGRDPTVCIREYLGGTADASVPSCWEAARNNGLSCVRPDGGVNIVDLPR